MIGAEQISQMLPHGEGMSMLDKVVSWDERSIRCETSSHRNPENPMLLDGELYCIALFEYAAQAAAVHAGLLHSNLGEVRPAFVGAIKQIELHQRLVRGDIPILSVEVHAEYLSSNGAIYNFSVTGEGELASGKLVLAQPATQ